MNLHALAAAIDAFPDLVPHRDWLLRIARPSVDIEWAEWPATPNGSRFGGSPWVPGDFAWPRHAVGEYRFLGQIDFGEIVDVGNGPRGDERPAAGLLSLFYATDEDGEVFWQDEAYVVGFYWRTPQDHRLLAAPGGTQPEARGLVLRTGLRLPERRELMGEDSPLDEDALETLLYSLPEACALSEQWLQGYPHYNSLGYDPTPGPGWVPLLTVPSIDALEWCWHDGDRLMIFIEAERLAACDFTHLRCDAG